MQDRFLKSLIYTLLGMAVLIFLMTQPFNAYCRATKKCHPITLSSFKIIKKGTKEININFTSEVNEDLRKIVEFYPVKKSLTKFSNEYVTNSYYVKNLSDKEITIKAMYKATPKEADQYLNRVECLCFQSEDLKAGESINMPIRFQIKKDIENVDMKNININYKIVIL